LGKLSVGRLAAKLVEQVEALAAHPRNFLHQMHRQADGFALVGQASLDRLLNPPLTVR
jgi:hypothetical protein